MPPVMTRFTLPLVKPKPVGLMPEIEADNGAIGWPTIISLIITAVQFKVFDIKF